LGKFIFGIIIGVIVIVFMVQNVETVTVNFFAWNVTIPRAIMVLIVFIVGTILGFIIRSIGYRKKRKEREESAKD
jgi:uncharacterized integral membrane protein